MNSAFGTRPTTTPAQINDANTRFHGQPVQDRAASVDSTSEGRTARKNANRGKMPQSPQMSGEARSKYAAGIGRLRAKGLPTKPSAPVRGYPKDIRHPKVGHAQVAAKAAGRLGKEAAALAKQGKDPGLAGGTARVAASFGKKALGQDIRHPKRGNTQEVHKNGQVVSSHDVRDPYEKAGAKSDTEHYAVEHQRQAALAKQPLTLSSPMGSGRGNGPTLGPRKPKGDADYTPATDKSVRDVNEANERYYNGNHKGMAQ